MSLNKLKERSEGKPSKIHGCPMSNSGYQSLAPFNPPPFGTRSEKVFLNQGRFSNPDKNSSRG
jgi:hypothetical protein